jgi:hypothetical protein
MNTVRLREVLQETKGFIEGSDEAVFADATPIEIATDLETAIIQIEKNEEVNTRYLGVLFAATCPIQETAMTNGWHDHYMRLATEFDKLIEGKT